MLKDDQSKKPKLMVRKKIVVIPSWYVSEELPGSGVFFRDQAVALSKYHDVTVLAPIFRSLRFINKRLVCKSGAYQEGTLKVFFKEFYYWPFLRSINLSNWSVVAGELLEEFISRNGHPDFIHYQSMYFSVGFIEQAYKLHGIPYFITEHASYFNKVKNIPLKKFVGAVNNAQLLFGVSKAFCCKLSAIFPGSKWNYMPNFIDEHSFFPGTTPIPTNVFRILTVCRLDKNKGVIDLLKAIEQLSDELNIELFIAGDGPERASLEAYTTLKGISHKVRFLGLLNREQVLIQMQQCHLFALASYSESFGVVIIEALATGKPVLATKCGGPESIINDNNGLLVPVADYISMSQGIRYIYNNYSKFNKDEIRKYFLDHFSSAALTLQLANIYQHESEAVNG